jgi:hypothetical protein
VEDMRVELDYRQSETQSSGPAEDELSKLELENLRLQQLVVELLFKNQQLREAVSLHRDDASGPGP